jgi:hypothetical protein
MQMSTCHPKKKHFLGLQPSDWTQKSCQLSEENWRLAGPNCQHSARLLIHEEEQEKSAEGQYILQSPR